MTTAELLDSAQYLVDDTGQKKAVVIEMSLWEKVLEILENIEDEKEMTRLLNSDEEIISWEQAKAELKATGLDV